RLRIVVLGMSLQVLFALLVLRTDLGRDFFTGANAVILALLDFSKVGANFVFGALAPGPGGASPVGYLFFFQTLTTIIFFAALMGVLYHLGIMQAVVRGVAFVMRRSLRTSGAETLS